MWGRIVLGTDGSPAASRAGETTATIAPAVSAELTAIPGSSAPGPAPEILPAARGVTGGRDDGHDRARRVGEADRDHWVLRARSGAGDPLGRARGGRGGRDARIEAVVGGRGGKSRRRVGRSG